MPDEYTVTESTEAHEIIIMTCAVGSTPALLGNASGTHCEEPKHTKK